MPEVRNAFERYRNRLQACYAELDWEQKATLLRALIEAGDHPPGFSISFDLRRTSTAERKRFLRDRFVTILTPGEKRELRDRLNEELGE